MENIPWNERVRLVEKRRWLICLPLALAFIIVYFHRFAMGVVSDSIMRDFGLARAAELGLLSSIYFYTYAVLQVPTGVSADYWGPRRTITAALVVTAAGTLIFGWASSLPWLYVGRFVTSAGIAFIYINIVKFFSSWFRGREFGTMSGLSSFIGNLGFALAATPLALMVENTGWRESFYIVGFITLLVAGYCWLTVRNTPAAYGWPSIEEIEAAEGAGPVAAGARCAVMESLRTVVANRHTWPPFLASTASYSVFATFAGVWGMPYLMQVHGLPRVEAAGYMMAVSAGYMFAGPVVGHLSDRFATRRWPFVAQMGWRQAAGGRPLPALPGPGRGRFGHYADVGLRQGGQPAADDGHRHRPGQYGPLFRRRPRPAVLRPGSRSQVARGGGTGGQGLSPRGLPDGLLAVRRPRRGGGGGGPVHQGNALRQYRPPGYRRQRSLAKIFRQVV